MTCMGGQGPPLQGRMQMNIILASASPRRRDLLKMIGVDNFKVIPYTGDEIIEPGLSPELTVCKIALEKARAASKKCGEEDLVIAADTLVYHDGLPLTKPDDERGAAAMLRILSGSRHTVYTGVALLRGGIYSTGAEKTDVYFRDISEGEIAAYINTGEPMDKAGAYGAQGRGAVFIERIEGDFFNVMGLPLCRLSMMLRGFGVFV